MGGALGIGGVAVHPALLHEFQRLVADECSAVFIATHQMNSSITASDQLVFWIGCKNLFTAAGNLSKALWGQPGQNRESARRALRESLQVAEDSPLRNVKMRNHFEHYDERLEQWWEHSLKHDPSLPKSEVKGRFLGYDPMTRDVIFRGVRYSAQAIFSEAERIYPIAVRAIKAYGESDSRPGTGQ